jgi:4-hydroxythreonine-4-phosphate dehydrogenase
MRAAAPLALTMGEPAGIGGEITLKAWAGRREQDIPPFVVFDDPDRLTRLADRLRLDAPIAVVADLRAAPETFQDRLPVLPISVEAEVRLGHPDPANGQAVIRSIEQAVGLASAGEAAAVVTNPIQKSALYAAGFGFPGHTEYLASLAGVSRSVMMLVAKDLRVVPVTIHVSLRRALESLSALEIIENAAITAEALRRDFAVAEPRLAVAGLNPHAGEAGTMGDEEAGIIQPAIDELRRRGIAVTGPHPPDTMFHDRARARYDAAICMYHDQALIPVKTIDFDGGVNVTLGLPFIRTSPDHGTALDIAGKGIANPSSLIAALKLADRLARNRARA